MLACPSCGGEIDEADRFCPHCRLALTGTPTSNPAVTPFGFKVKGPNDRDRLLERLRRATEGRFEIIRRLGHGGMAAVYLARDARLDRQVAIKVMLPELEITDGMTEKFWDEARRTARLSHPNIVIVHSVDELDDLVLFVMNLINGASLEQVLPHLNQSGTQGAARVSLSVAQSILLQVSAGLAYAHEEGVVHRDIKPSNIMVTVKGEVIITDFGIAKVTAGLPHAKSSLLMGTPTYMSPEQCMGHPVSGASDQYATGVLAYELLSGSLPFTGTVLDIQNAHVSRTPPSLHALRPDLPKSIANAVMRMLAKTPSERFSSMDEVARALSEGFNALDQAPRRMLGSAAAAARDSGGQVVSPTPVVQPGYTPVAASLSLVAPSEVRVGESFFVAATARDGAGGTLFNVPVSLRSEDPRILAVVGARGGSPLTTGSGESGEVRALRAGKGRLIAEGGNTTATLIVTVLPKAGAATRARGPSRRLALTVGLLALFVLGGVGVVVRRRAGRVPVESLVSGSALSQLRQQAATISDKRVLADLGTARWETSTVRKGRLLVDGSLGALNIPEGNVASDNLIVHFDAVREAGDSGSEGAGIALPTGQPGSAYLVLLNDRGERPFRLLYRNAGQTTALPAGVPVASRVDTSAVTNVDVVIWEGRLTLYLNGTSVASDVSLPRSASGQVKIFVSPGLRYSFANLLIAGLTRAP